MLKNRQTLIIAALGAIVLAMCTYSLLPARQPLNVTIMDVGEGLCIVTRTPSGKTILMDCGTSSWRDNSSVGESVVLPYLSKSGVRSIDVLIASHPHEDHISGLPTLMAKVPPKLVLDSGSRERSATYKRFLSAVRKSKATYRIAQSGQVLDMSDGVIIQVLSPPASDDSADRNAHSVVIRVIYGKTAFVLAADADEESESEMLKSNQPIRAQVLQVGHHGSRTASSPEWLAAVRPQIAVISCGRRNLYGHPSPQTLGRLAGLGTRVYRTDRDGAVTITSDGHTITARSMARR